MAISLTKMTVPLATDQSATSQGLLMPKLQYRFRVSFLNFGVDNITTELTKQVIDLSRPNVSFEKVPLDVYNSKVYIAGKHTWDPMNINLREDVNANVQKLVGQQLQKQFDFYEQSSAASGQDYKFTMVIEILDGGNGEFVPGVLETFELFGCFIENATYNTLNYATSEPVTISLTISFDNAIQTEGGGQVGIGTNVGRFVNTLATGAGS
jgi:hypothetical protein|tara:strand:- start:2313 stop:2942 length:630 start_codon:yes stop_codon:yes gene_type:complete